jgi:two-component system cell cycle sensor histidine kinase/response regulator CckA
VAAPADEATPAPSSQRRPGGERVLVVEDEASVRKLMVEALRRDGYDVLAVDDGDAALSALEGAQPPAVVVSDVVLPHMTGFELEARIHERLPDTPVLFVSGYGDAMVPDLAAVPPARVLPKPFTPGALLRAVRRALSARRAAG